MLPASVSLFAKVDVHKRIVLGLDRLLDQRQAGLLWGLAAFFDVAICAGADDIFPDRFAAHTARNNVVERQLAGWESSATILAAIFVAGKDVPAVKFYVVLRQAVVEQ